MNEVRIIVQNRQRKLRVACLQLQAFADRALAMCLALSSRKTPLRSLSCIHVLLISDRRIAELHRRFMNLSGPTDVITFEHGEIFVSAEAAKRQAKQFGTSITRELQLYILHGLLHLHGFDDDTPAAARRMGSVQARLLRQLAG